MSSEPVAIVAAGHAAGYALQLAQQTANLLLNCAGCTYVARSFTNNGRDSL